MFLVYLECKLQQDTYGSCIFKLKWEKTVERTYLWKSKQQTKCHWYFYLLKWLRKGSNCDFGPYEQIRRVQSMYLAFKYPK